MSYITANGETSNSSISCMKEARNIFLEGELNMSMAGDFVRFILMLTAMGKEPINVFINSPGGHVTAGLIMYDVIQGSQVPIRLYCIGVAYSMAAILFVSGAHGRYLLPHAEIMLHEPSLGMPVGGNRRNLEHAFKSVTEVRDKLCKIIASHTHHTVKTIKREIGYDHFFTAQEALKFGLCDEVIPFGEFPVGLPNAEKTEQELDLATVPYEDNLVSN